MSDTETDKKTKVGRGTAFSLRCKFENSPDKWCYYSTPKEFCDKLNITYLNLLAAIKFGNPSNITIHTKTKGVSVVFLKLQRLPCVINGVSITAQREFVLPVIQKLYNFNEAQAIDLYNYDYLEPLYNDYFNSS